MATMRDGYDFTNFAVAKTLAGPEWTAQTLAAIRNCLGEVIADARDVTIDSLPGTALVRLGQLDAPLALALRERTAGRSRSDVLELLDVVLDVVSAMQTAASNGRLTRQLRDTLVYTTLP